MDIKLNFVNRSNDANNSQVVISAKNAATDTGGLTMAWLVIDNCGPGDDHPFVFPMQITVDASDSDGNYTPQLPAESGQLFIMSRTSSGDQLSESGGSGGPGVTVRNALDLEAIDACFYRAGKVFFRQTIPSQQTSTFEFKPTIWIGVASKITEGQVLNANTELSLSGIASADIVMTGGGPGIDASRFEFTLDNVVKA